MSKMQNMLTGGKKAFRNLIAATRLGFKKKPRKNEEKSLPLTVSISDIQHESSSFIQNREEIDASSVDQELNELQALTRGRKFSLFRPVIGPRKNASLKRSQINLNPPSIEDGTHEMESPKSSQKQLSKQQKEGVLSQTDTTFISSWLTESESLGDTRGKARKGSTETGKDTGNVSGSTMQKIDINRILASGIQRSASHIVLKEDVDPSTLKMSSVKMTVPLILLLALVTIVSNWIAVIYLLAKPLPYEHPYSCQSNNCNRMKSWLLDSINQSVHPCDDFYEFVCGKYVLNHPPDSMFPLSENGDNIQIDYNENEHLGTFLERVEDFPENQILPFYKACIDTERRNNQKYEPFVAFLAHIGLLFQLEGNFYSDTFNIGALLARLFRTTGKIYFFEFVGIDFDLIQIKPVSPHKIGTKADPQIYGRVLYAAFKLMADDLMIEDSELVTIVQVVMQLEAQIVATLNPNKRIYGYPNKMWNYIKIEPREDMHPNFNERTGTFYWKDFIDALKEMDFFGLGNQTYVFDQIRSVKQNPIYRHQVLSVAILLNKTPIYTIVRYIQWQLMKTFAFDLTEEFANLMYTIFPEYGRHVIERCFRSVFNHLHILAGQRYLRKNFDPELLYERVSMIVKNIRSVFEKLKFTTTDRVNKMFHTRMKNSKFVETQVQKNENGADWKKFYKGMNLSRTNHFTNVMKAMAIRARNMILRSRNIPEYMQWVTGTYDLTQISFFFSKKDPGVVYYNTPWVALQGPYMGNDLDLFNYAGIGYWIIITYFLRTVAFTYLEEITKVKLSNRGRLSERKDFENLSMTAECILNQYESLKIGGEKLNPYTEWSGLLAVLDNLAVQSFGEVIISLLKHSDILAFPEEFKDYQILPGMEEFSKPQLMYIAMTRHACIRYTQPVLQHHLRYGPIPYSLRMNGALRNSVKFAKTWGCPVDSFMNPKSKCTFINELHLNGKIFKDHIIKKAGGYPDHLSET